MRDLGTMKNFYQIMAVICSGTVILFAGCLGPSVSYNGKTFPAVTDAKLITDKKQMSGYKVIGRCSVSGKYQSCTLADLKKSLLKKPMQKALTPSISKLMRS